MSGTSCVDSRTWPEWYIRSSPSMASNVADEDEWSLLRCHHHVAPSLEKRTVDVDTGHTSILLVPIITHYVALGRNVVRRFDESSGHRELTCPSVPDSLDILVTPLTDQTTWIVLGLSHCST